MDKDFWEAILETREIEFRRTKETRQMIYDLKMVVIELLGMLMRNGSIEPSQYREICNLMTKGEESDG